MKEKKLKLNLNIVGVTPLDDSLFEENSQNKNSSKFCQNPNFKHQTLISDHSAITLIALVITIIVMLILVGVTINIAINGGIFEKAKEAKTKTLKSIEEEQKWAEGKVQADGNWYNSVQDYLDGKELITGNWTLSDDGSTVKCENVTLNVGDYVDYIPNPEISSYSTNKLTKSYTGSEDNNLNLTTDTNLKWRVLGVDKNRCLTLISDKPTLNTTVNFANAVGYNNGVYILNDVCEKLYSDNNLGIKARSLTIEDIEGGFNQTGITQRDSYTTYEGVYGKTNTYVAYYKLNYPVIYAQEYGSGIGVTEERAEKDIKKDGIGRSDPYYNESQLTNKPEGVESKQAGDKEGEAKALTCMQTYYELNFSDSTNYCKNPTFRSIIFDTGSSFWIASRNATYGTGGGIFGLFNVLKNTLKR